jgi:hypothetical protein
MHLADRYVKGRPPLCRPADGETTDYVDLVTCGRCLRRLAALVLLGEAVIEADLVYPTRVRIQ